jgi:hypothetical protein
MKIMEKMKEKEKTKNKTCCGYVSKVTHTHIYLFRENALQWYRNLRLAFLW